MNALQVNVYKQINEARKIGCQATPISLYPPIPYLPYFSSFSPFQKVTHDTLVVHSTERAGRW